jgi:large subunit ribosomal protein L25
MSKIVVETRPKASSAAAERMRKNGHLPMALIEKSKETRLISAPIAEVREVLASKEGLKIFPLSLDNGAREMKVVVKQIQRHDVTRKVTTIVLQEIIDEDRIRIDVPVQYVGTPRAVAKNLASLITPVNTLPVQAKVKDLPEFITVELGAMRQNDRILLSDLNLPEGLTPLSSLETVVASTVQLRGMATFDDDAAIAAEKAAAG